MKKILRKNMFLGVILLTYIVLLLAKRDLAYTALSNSAYYVKEMALILPVIFMVIIVIDVLVPKEWIIKRLGSQSGVMGSVLALAFGSLSAGPIYAAFPIAKMLHKKGASVKNIVIIISAWAVIKIPMLANEARFLGPKFMVVRWILTVGCIVLIAWLMDKLHVEIKESKPIGAQPIAIKKEYCVGCGACAKKMPEVFAMEGTKAYVKTGGGHGKLPTLLENQVFVQTVKKCPTRAIIVDATLE